VNKWLFLTAVAIFSILSLVAGVAHADILFNKTTAVAIGHGTADGSKVHWADCSDQNKQDFDKPPYWIDKADNCQLKPFSFGLEQKDGKYLVKDITKFQMFFPAAKTGDEASFRLSDKGVELSHQGKVIMIRH